MVKHLPLKVVKDITSGKISSKDRKIIDNIQKHNSKVYAVPHMNAD